MTTEMTTTASRGLALATFEDAFRFAKIVAASDFAPKDFRGKPESCLLAIQHGSEIGLSPMQSLQNIACINGRPAIWGDAALAVAMASSVCEYVREEITGEGDSWEAHCTAKRRGYEKPTVVTFTVADAKKAGLWGKTGPWTQYPKRMLQLRARGFALRDAFPDVLKGLVTAEEAQDYTTAEVTRPTVTQLPKAESVKAREAREYLATATTRAALDKATRGIDGYVASGDLTGDEWSTLTDAIAARREQIENATGEPVAVD